MTVLKFEDCFRPTRAKIGRPFSVCECSCIYDLLCTRLRDNTNDHYKRILCPLKVPRATSTVARCGRGTEGNYEYLVPRARFTEKCRCWLSLLHKYRPLPGSGVRLGMCRDVYIIDYKNINAIYPDDKTLHDTLNVYLEAILWEFYRAGGRYGFVHFYHNYRNSRGIPQVSFSATMPNTVDCV